MSRKTVHPLRAWRERKGLVQPEAAALFRCSVPMLSMVERGVSRPGIKLAHRIARVTGVSLERLRPLGRVA